MHDVNVLCFARQIVQLKVENSDQTTLRFSPAMYCAPHYHPALSKEKMESFLTILNKLQILNTHNACNKALMNTSNSNLSN
jgi:hypothetical protein